MLQRLCNLCFEFRFKVAYLYVVLAVYTSFSLSEDFNVFHVCHVFKADF